MGMSAPFTVKPIMPDMEFTKINKADTAAACFILPQPNKIIIGLSMMPPPMPIIPEKSPMAEPINKDPIRLKGLTSFFSVPRKFSIRRIAIARNTPKICLYNVASMEMYPPIKAIGIEVMAKG